MHVSYLSKVFCACKHTVKSYWFCFWDSLVYNKALQTFSCTSVLLLFSLVLVWRSLNKTLSSNSFVAALANWMTAKYKLWDFSSVSTAEHLKAGLLCPTHDGSRLWSVKMSKDYISQDIWQSRRCFRLLKSKIIKRWKRFGYITLMHIS